MKKKRLLLDGHGKHRRLRRRLHLFAGLVASVVVAVALLPAAVAATTPGVGASDDAPTSVKPPRRPTEVTAAVYLIGLSRISDPSDAFPTVDVEAFLDLSWNDPRLAFEGSEPMVFQGEEAEEQLSEIWSPDPEIQNEIEQRETESVELILLPDGTVQYEERFGATINAELDLARFPFDDQTLILELQSFLWDHTDCAFVANAEQIGFDADFRTPEWVVTAVEGVIGVRSEIRDDRDFSAFTFSIHASRNAGHYVLRFMMPLFFVMGLTWAAFWMPLEGRFRVGFIALLTVVASHTVIAQQLPRLHYPTFADVLLIICYFFAAALIVVSIRLQQLIDAEHDHRAVALERRARWMLPIGTAIAFALSSLWLLGR